ncbi:MAG: TOBE domain-containing protein [Nitrospiraceae bacterium]|nr:TOBE domain-containing protein [Nitrospiraceae bacterium]
MKISARNFLPGTVSDIKRGQVMSVIRLELKGGNAVTSIITNESADRLGLKTGASALAVIKATSVIVGKVAGEVKLSARNIIKGNVQMLKEGMVMAEVVLDIGGGNTITSIISDDSAKRLGLKEKDEAYAIIKATSVMMGVAD